MSLYPDEQLEGDLSVECFPVYGLVKSCILSHILIIIIMPYLSIVFIISNALVFSEPILPTSWERDIIRYYQEEDQIPKRVILSLRSETSY